jgi:serine protease Do
VQTTTQISPGNSGGPLFNARGQVIGVTNMKIPLGEGLGFAIPVNYVVDFLRNREAFAFNKENPNTGYHYQPPPRRRVPLKREATPAK